MTSKISAKIIISMAVLSLTGIGFAIYNLTQAPNSAAETNLTYNLIWQVVVAITLNIIFGFMVYNKLKRPAKDLQDVLQKLNRGNYNFQTPYCNLQNEIGHIAKEIDSLKYQYLTQNNTVKAPNITTKQETLIKPFQSEDLKKRTDDIMQIALEISRVSEELRLLAINGNIAAVKAGENGKSFYHIANEVKDFSKKTDNLSKDILDVIDENPNKKTTKIERIKRDVDASKKENLKDVS